MKTDPVRAGLLMAHEAMRELGDRRFFINDEGNVKGPCSPQDLTDRDEVLQIIEPSDRTVRAGQYARRLRRLANRARKQRP